MAQFVASYTGRCNESSRGKIWFSIMHKFYSRDEVKKVKKSNQLQKLKQYKVSSCRN